MRKKKFGDHDGGERARALANKQVRKYQTAITYVAWCNSREKWTVRVSFSAQTLNRARCGQTGLIRRRNMLGDGVVMFVGEFRLVVVYCTLLRTAAAKDRGSHGCF